MSFEQQVKDWVSIDNQIKQHNDELKDLRSQRTSLAQSINTYVEDNELKHAVIQISDGKLKFQTTKVTQPITLKFVKECLDDCIQDEDSVSKIMKYIKDQREVKYTSDIKRYYAKE
jgi:hypothetical protein